MILLSCASLRRYYPVQVIRVDVKTSLSPKGTPSIDFVLICFLSFVSIAVVH